MAIFYSSGAILIQDRQVLMVRAGHHNHFVAPGGSIEEGETAEQAIIRELHEELSITVPPAALVHYGMFTAEAANHPGNTINMQTFMVQNWVGKPVASREVAELLWLQSGDVGQHKLGSIFATQIIPQLVIQNLIN